MAHTPAGGRVACAAALLLLLLLAAPIPTVGQDPANQSPSSQPSETASPNASPSPKPDPASPSPQPKQDPASPSPQPKQDPASPSPQPKQDPASPSPQPKQDPASPSPQPKQDPASPSPQPKQDPASPSPQPKPGPASPSPQPKPGPASPSPQPKPASPSPVKASPPPKTTPSPQAKSSPAKAASPPAKPSPAPSPSPQAEDARRLLVFKNSFTNGKTVLINWAGNSPCNDTWLGLDCSDSGRVIGIELDGEDIEERLQGSIPSTGWTLPTSLERLVLSNNNITGPLPSKWALPANLTMDLHNNMLEGTLPAFSVSGLTIYIRPGNSRLCGDVPAQYESYDGELVTELGPCGAPSPLSSPSPSFSPSPSPSPSPSDTVTISDVPVATTSSPPAPAPPGPSPSPVGAIVGGVIGGLAAVAVVSLFSYKWYRYHKLYPEAGLFGWFTPAAARLRHDAKLGADKVSGWAKAGVGGVRDWAKPGSQDKLDLESGQPSTLNETSYGDSPRPLLGPDTQSQNRPDASVSGPFLASILAGEARTALEASFVNPTFQSIPRGAEGDAGTPGAPAWGIPFHDLSLEKCIGEDSNSRVFMGEWGMGGESLPVAVRVLGATDSDPALAASTALATAAQVQPELQTVSALMETLQHPNVQTFLAVCASPPCIVYDYADYGSLADILQQARNSPQLAQHITWHRRLAMLLDAAQGLEFLHSCSPPIVHGNLKSSSLLVWKDWTVKVGNFTALEGAGSVTPDPRWLAPEVLKGQEPSPASDVFAFGVVMWQAATWELPWVGSDSEQVATYVKAGGRLQFPAAASLPGAEGAFAGLQAFTALVQDCMSQGQTDRPTFTEIIKHLRSIMSTPGAANATLERREEIILEAAPSEEADNDIQDLKDWLHKRR